MLCPIIIPFLDQPLPCSTFLVNQANLNPLQDKHMQCCKYSPSFALLNIPSHPCSSSLFSSSSFAKYTRVIKARMLAFLIQQKTALPLPCSTFTNILDQNDVQANMQHLCLALNSILTLSLANKCSVDSNKLSYWHS